MAPAGRNFTVRILPTEDPKDFSYPRLQQGGKKVMFFGAISKLGKIHFSTLKAKVDSERFGEFLQNEALPAVKNVHNSSFILQMDNASPHKGFTSDIIKIENIKTLVWPAQSPDLNPIEQVWLWMALKIGPKIFKDIVELEEYVFSLWEEIPKNTILAFLEKMTEKLKWVIESEEELYPDHHKEI